MKKIIYTIIAIYLCNFSQMLAQSFCVDRGYNTNVNWRDRTFTMYIDVESTIRTLNNVDSPFYASLSSPYYNDNISLFSNALVKDFQEKDGWVLVEQNFGTPQKAVKNAHLILYNKYTGILRLFILTGQRPTDVAQTAYIELQYYKSDDISSNDYNFQTANLDMYSDKKYRNALDERVERTVVSKPNKWENQSFYWLYADFKMNYDPCVCNVRSRLTFAVKLLQTSTVNLSINGTLIQDMPEGDKPAGTSLVKNLESSVGGVVKAAEMGFGIAAKPFKFLKESFGLGGDNESNKNSKSFISIADKVVKGLGGIGAAIGIIESFAGLFNEKPEEKPQPLILKADLKATGTIVTPFSVGSVNKYIPGTDNLSFIQPTEIVYNNPLGVFNLLTTPTINYANLYGTGYEFRFQLADKIKYLVNPHSGLKQDKVDIEGQYVIEANDPNAFKNNGFCSDHFIKVNETTYATAFASLDCLSDWQVQFRARNVSIYLRLVANMYPTEQQYENITISEAPGVCIYFYGFNPNTGLYENPTVDINCPNIVMIDRADLVSIQLNGSYLVRSPISKPITTHIGKYKLNRINAQPSDVLNNTNPINDIGGFKLYSSDGYVPYVEYGDNGGSYLTYYACETMPEQEVVNAWHNIYIGCTKIPYQCTDSGFLDLEVYPPGANGYELPMQGLEKQKIMAGNTIEIVNSTLNIGTEITLGSGFVCENTRQSVGSDEVEYFCNSTSYIDGRDMKPALTQEQAAEGKPSENKLSVYPNPASDLVTFTYELEKVTESKMYVTNMMGVKIADYPTPTRTENGKYEIIANVSSWATGIYLVVLEANGERIVKKLVVNK